MKQASLYSSIFQGGGKRRSVVTALCHIAAPMFLSVSNSSTVSADMEASAMEIAGLVVGTISLLIAIYFGVRALQKE